MIGILFAGCITIAFFQSWDLFLRVLEGADHSCVRKAKQTNDETKHGEIIEARSTKWSHRVRSAGNQRISKRASTSAMWWLSRNFLPARSMCYIRGPTMSAGYWIRRKKLSGHFHEVEMYRCSIQTDIRIEGDEALNCVCLNWAPIHFDFVEMAT